MGRTRIVAILGAIAAVLVAWLLTRNGPQPPRSQDSGVERLGGEFSSDENREVLAASSSDERREITTISSEPTGAPSRPAPISDLIASGQVTDERGEPIEGAKLSALPPGFDHWNATAVASGSTSDRLGRFELRGRFVGATVEVRADDFDHIGTASAVVPIGSTDVQLVLPRGGSLSGSLELDPKVPLLGVSVVVSNEGPVPSDHRATWTLDWRRSGGGDSRIDIGVEGTFQFRGLEPGSYAARVELAYDSTLVFEIRGVPVQAGEETRDPRLDPIDLRGLFRVFVIDVVDESGKPIDHGFHSWMGGGQSLPGKRLTFERGRFFVIARDLPVELEVGAAGYRTVRVPEVDGPRTVVLRAGIRAQLVLRGCMVPDPPRTLRVALVPEGRGGDSRRKLGPGAKLILALEGFDSRTLDRIRQASSSSYFDGVDLERDGRAVAELPGPGSYRVDWYLSTPGDDGETTIIEGIQVPRSGTVEVGSGDIEPTFFLDLDPLLVPAPSKSR